MTDFENSFFEKLAGNPGVAECLAALEVSRRELLALLDGASDEALARRPAPDEWSAAMTAEHLALVEGSVARAIRYLRSVALRGETRQVTVEPGAMSAAGRPIAPPLVTPKGEMSRQEVLAALDASRAGLLDQVEAGRETIDDPASLPHPFFGPLNGLGWLRMAAFHEPHHMNQIAVAIAAAENG